MNEPTPKDARRPADIPESTDVIVIGYGFAGGASAIAAADAGAQVLLLEKMAVPGGISICSGGGFRVALDETRALTYLEATNAGSIPSEQLQAMARAMAALPEFIHALARASGATVKALDRPANYPFAGCEAFQFLEISHVPDFDPRRDYPHARSLGAGINAFKLIDDQVRSRPTIEVRLSTPVLKLLTDADRRVIGVEVPGAEGPRRILARGGVVLACGGFEAGTEMQKRYWQMRPVLPASTLGNTGDGFRMAQALGAELSHMWHFHGTYGFRHVDDSYPFGIRTKKLPDWTPEKDQGGVPMTWILLDRGGQRFMNEYEPYLHDTGHRGMDGYDATRQRFSALPALLLFDEVGRQRYPVARSYTNDPHIAPYDWSEDNLREVELGILQRADSLEALAQQMQVPPAELNETLARWNAACASGAPDPFGRPANTRLPISTPPYYFGHVWPVVSNTQGALVHDTGQRVLDTFGQPIDGLYVAGELGSIWGFLYLSGGNLAECLISGRLAGQGAALSTDVRGNREERNGTMADADRADRPVRNDRAAA